MAIERTDRRAKIDYPYIATLRCRGPALTEATIRHSMESIDVPVTDPVRTVVGCIRYRAEIGPDITLRGQGEALRRRRYPPDELSRYARTAHGWSALAPYVETIVSDAA